MKRVTRVFYSTAMGLLLSILVVCVGVVEVIACVRHFQDGYLPLWASRRVASGCATLHEYWRTKPSIEYERGCLLDKFTYHVNDNHNLESFSESKLTNSNDKALVSSEPDLLTTRNENELSGTTSIKTLTNLENNVLSQEIPKILETYSDNVVSVQVNKSDTNAPADLISLEQLRINSDDNISENTFRDISQSSTSNEISQTNFPIISRFSEDGSLKNVTLDTPYKNTPHQDIHDKVTPGQDTSYQDTLNHVTYYQDIPYQVTPYQDIPYQVTPYQDSPCQDNPDQDTSIVITHPNTEVSEKKFEETISHLDLPELLPSIDTDMCVLRNENIILETNIARCSDTGNRLELSNTSSNNSSNFTSREYVGKHTIEHSSNNDPKMCLNVKENSIQNLSSVFGNLKSYENKENVDQNYEGGTEVPKHVSLNDLSSDINQHSSFKPTVILEHSIMNQQTSTLIPCSNVEISSNLDAYLKEHLSSGRNNNPDNSSVVEPTLIQLREKYLDATIPAHLDTNEELKENYGHSLMDAEEPCDTGITSNSVKPLSNLTPSPIISRKTKADISWPTFTPAPVIKRPSISFPKADSIASEISFDVDRITPELPDFITEEKNIGSNDNDLAKHTLLLDECKEVIIIKEECPQTKITSNISPTIPYTDTSLNNEFLKNESQVLIDSECIEDTPLPVVAIKEFSKKEMALKRRTSYKARRFNTNSEGLSGSEDREEKSCIEEHSNNPMKPISFESDEGVKQKTQPPIELTELKLCERVMEENTDNSLDENGQNITVSDNGINTNIPGYIIDQTQANKSIEGEESIGTFTEMPVCKSDVKIGSTLEKANVKEHDASITSLPINKEGVSSSEETVTLQQTTPNKEAFWLIFSGEYTKAMSKDWHSGHFCCWQCDESLTGQRYVLRDDHPYCIKCYESVFANVCEECNKIIGIDSKDLSYKDKHWHEACFLCNKCRVSLVDKQFGSKADKIYCGNCYDAQFASRCDGCGEIFRAGTKKMEYKTRQWHEKCFCCCVCKSAIGTKSFIPREQEIYCATCYEEKFATRCVKCNKIITSGGVTYKNEPWHRECFTCTNCNTSLAGQRFTSRDEKPYCAECFGELFAKRCTACVKPITGIGGTRFISFEDRHWHNDCFICATCKTSLVGRGFITDGDDIICPECAKQKLM